MHIGEIKTCDTANGPGMRVTLFVSGCTNKCKGCFQPETWDFCYGKPFTKEDEDFIINELNKGYYEGLTLLGGEPFEPQNQAGLVPFLRRVKDECPDMDIWAFTGFTYEERLLPGKDKYTEVTDDMLSMIDVLVDGKFILEQKDVRLRFRGSRNQRIIDLKKTIESKAVVLSEYNN